MITKDEVGKVCLVGKDLIYSRRQDTPQCFDMSTVAYVANPKFIISSQNIWQGRVAGVEIPVERAIDIDNEIDFKFASFLLKERES